MAPSSMWTLEARELWVAPKADLILVTDVHGDHLDPEMIAKLSQDSTEVVVSTAVAEKLGSGTVMANGKTREIAGVSIEAVPMYNLQRGPEEGKLFHVKGRGNGYILTLGGKRIYFAGDTACPPDEGSAGHRIGFCTDESAVHHATRRSCRMCCSLQAGHRLPVSLQGFRSADFRGCLERPT